MTDYEKVAREVTECQHCQGQGWRAEQVSDTEQEQVQCPNCYYGVEVNHELLLERISEALRTAVEKERERLIEALPEEFPEENSSADFGREEIMRMRGWNAYRAGAIKKLRGKDTPQNG